MVTTMEDLFGIKEHNNKEVKERKMKQQVDNINMNEKEDEVEINLLDLFNYYRKKIIFIIIGFVVGAIIAGLVTKFLITQSTLLQLKYTWYLHQIIQ